MRLASLLLLALGGLSATAQEKSPTKKAGGHPPVIAGAKVETYRTVGSTELKVWIIEPADKGSKPRPAIVFFFGGGWTSGTPAQFEPQARHLAARGMVAVLADYRVKSRQDAKPADCVADAKACVRWVRANATRLGLDPDRLAVGGGSAGGHLAASVATLPGLDPATDDKAVSCRLELKGFGAGLDKGRFGCEPTEISPIHHVKKGLPPTIIFHGKTDTTVPYATVEKFTEVMKAAGNRCELVGYEGQPHGFFNKAKYQETLDATDAFLVSLGYLPAKK